MIDRLGLHNVIVKTKEIKEEEQQEVRKKSLGVSPRDGEAIRQAVAGVEMVLPARRSRSAGRSARRGPRATRRYRRLAQQPDVAAVPIREGRFFDAAEESGHAQVARDRRERAARSVRLRFRRSASGSRSTSSGSRSSALLAPEASATRPAGDAGRLDRERDLDPGDDGDAEVRPRSSGGAARRADRAARAGRLAPGRGGADRRAPRPPARRRDDYELVVPKRCSNRAGGRSGSSTS